MKRRNAPIHVLLALTGLALATLLPGCVAGYDDGPDYDDGIFVGGVYGYDHDHHWNAFHHDAGHHGFGEAGDRGHASMGSGGHGGGSFGHGGGGGGGGGGGHR